MPSSPPVPADAGWDDRCAALFAPHADAGLIPGRVARVDRGAATVLTAAGPVRAATPAGNGPDDTVAVGDWVALDAEQAVAAILERRSALVRRDAGGTTEAQVLAANVDHVLLLHPLDGPPNLRRIERELVVAWDSGALPVVVLTKADLVAPDVVHDQLAEVEAIAPGVDVHAVSVADGRGLAGLEPVVAQGTVVLLGPSGAGKSSLANALLGEERQATGEVRARDGKGRHTTVASQLLPLAGGGLLIDTPGLRALALWEAVEGLGLAFPDIERFAVDCRFTDCTHRTEPGCAVVAAAEREELAPERLESWHRLADELARLELDRDARARAERKRQSKLMSKAQRAHYRGQQR